MATGTLVDEIRPSLPKGLDGAGLTAVSWLALLARSGVTLQSRSTVWIE